MDTKRLRTDIIIYALLLIACAALYFWITPAQVVVNLNLAGSTDFTPQTFPNLLTGCIAIAAAIGLVTSIVKYVKLRQPGGTGEKAPFGRHEVLTLLLPYLTFVIIIVYSVLFEHLGYIWATLIVPPIMMLLFGCRKWYFYAAVYGFSALMYVLFRFVLNVPLP